MLFTVPLLNSAWTSNEHRDGLEPHQAAWREYDTVVRHPASLSQVDELFLMLVRLQLNLKEQDIVDHFEISVSSVSGVFTTWINYCYLKVAIIGKCISWERIS